MSRIEIPENRFNEYKSKIKDLVQQDKSFIDGDTLDGKSSSFFLPRGSLVSLLYNNPINILAVSTGFTTKIPESTYFTHTLPVLMCNVPTFINLHDHDNFKVYLNITNTSTGEQLTTTEGYAKDNIIYLIPEFNLNVSNAGYTYDAFIVINNHKINLATPITYIVIDYFGTISKPIITNTNNFNEIESNMYVNLSEFHSGNQLESHVSTDWILVDQDNNIIYQELNDTINKYTWYLDVDYLKNLDTHHLYVRFNGKYGSSQYTKLDIKIKEYEFIYKLTKVDQFPGYRYSVTPGQYDGNLLAIGGSINIGAYRGSFTNTMFNLNMDNYTWGSFDSMPFSILYASSFNILNGMLGLIGGGAPYGLNEYIALYNGNWTLLKLPDNLVVGRFPLVTNISDDEIIMVLTPMDDMYYYEMYHYEISIPDTGQIFRIKFFYNDSGNIEYAITYIGKLVDFVTNADIFYHNGFLYMLGGRCPFTNTKYWSNLDTNSIRKMEILDNSIGPETLVLQLNTTEIMGIDYRTDFRLTSTIKINDNEVFLFTHSDALSSSPYHGLQLYKYNILTNDLSFMLNDDIPYESITANACKLDNGPVLFIRNEYIDYGTKWVNDYAVLVE